MAVDMFLVLEGIKGETVDATMSKEKALDILAWSWGMSQTGTTHMGTGAGSGKVSVQDISFTHWVDLASPVMMQKCCKGTHIPSGKLVVRKAGDKPLDYIVIEMKDIIISSISSGGSGGEDRLTENVTLNFAEFKYTYTQQTKDGGKGDAPEVSWNIAENIDK